MIFYGNRRFLDDIGPIFPNINRGFLACQLSKQTPLAVKPKAPTLLTRWTPARLLSPATPHFSPSVSPSASSIPNGGGEMKVTVMTADEQILSLDVDPDESVSSPAPSSLHLNLSVRGWPVSLNLAMNLRRELEMIWNFGRGEPAF